MKKLLQPKVLLPVILSAALIAALLAFGNIDQIIAAVTRFNRIDLLYFFLLMVAYEVVRGTQWHVLLKGLDIHVPLRTQVFTFAGGEAAKSLPIGNYLQNYLLQQSKGEDFSRSSAATVLVVLIEVGVAMLGLVIIGLGGWSVWLRPLILIGSAVFGLLAWAYHTFHESSRMPKWIRGHKRLQRAWEEFRKFREGAADLLHWRTMVPVCLLGALYLVIAGAGLYVVARGLGLSRVSFPDVLAVYFFGLAVGLIFPLPVDVGVSEVSNVGAFLVVGASKSAAVSATLLNRVLSLLAALVIAAAVVAILRDELRAVLESRADQSTDGKGGADGVYLSLHQDDLSQAIYEQPAAKTGEPGVAHVEIEPDEPTETAGRGPLHVDDETGRPIGRRRGPLE